MTAPDHAFRSITHPDGSIDVVELCDRSAPDAGYTTILTIHGTDRDAFLRWWNHMRQERAHEAFKAGWEAGAGVKVNI